MSIRGKRQWNTGLWNHGVTWRHFAEEGGEEGGSAGAATLEGEGKESSENWFDTLEVSDEDRPIYSKYKSSDEALKSLAPRERQRAKAVTDSKIPWPDEHAKPEESWKQQGAILQRLGAPKEVAGYKSIIDDTIKHIPEGLQGKIGPNFWTECMEDGVEANMTPAQFKRTLDKALIRMEKKQAGPVDDQVARQDALEKSLKVRHNLRWGEHLQNAELFASHLDEMLLRNPKGLTGEDGQPPRHAVTDLLKRSQDPVLHAVFDHLFDVHLSEGGLRPPVFGGQGDDRRTQFYKEAQTRYPKRGAEYWEGYAEERMAGRR